jgi:molecular chaperone GrpE (heat shock protein)
MQVNENEPAQNVCETIKPDSKKEAVENSLKLEASFRTQTENLEKQMVEFKKMAHTVQQSAREHSEPLNSTLKDMNQQVAAIREYASQQQDRVEKLQDGYDWNIVRRFCLRVIRCIDNLESRIEQLSEQGAETVNLEEIRDELVFALESSGVEQFEPEIKSDYRGQEKFAEVIKEKERSDDPKMAGKIAEVIRPGYQYVINEENIKVVRTAQVKLFG